jgi:hypothetical protein
MFVSLVMIPSCSGGTFNHSLNAWIIRLRISLPGDEVMYLNGSRRAYNAESILCIHPLKLEFAAYSFIPCRPVIDIIHGELL